ncbi:MAG: hypothetical protein GWO00_15885 [Gemmatimonadetes bacterium]|nr:hypothetical protein [Gemmatimonadota bacterium]NIT89805.1 hypothetical protein [Gemmatimonadota bacterium]NIU33591.1 hypothetical protein [Gemmatimonadota bacterium]NIV63924.1 hypothetical protein [Gemmatimonadota bacterium]NIW66669.1 hypothetical protein [Gemmatimonadota bacterium]
MKEKSRERIPAEVRAVIERAVEELRESGTLDEVPGPGSPAPRFARPTPEGETVRLDTLLAEGPVILSFYRGRW